MRGWSAGPNPANSSRKNDHEHADRNAGRRPRVGRRDWRLRGLPRRKAGCSASPVFRHPAGLDRSRLAVPVDEWGGGWAFQCKAADCGTDVNLYLRPKIGFCNCGIGVADDDELDRVSDTDLLGSEKSALGAGRPIKVDWMKGRGRIYKVAASWGSPFRSAKSLLSLAFNPVNDTCDVIVATVVAGDDPLAQEQAVLAFLDGDLVRQHADEVLPR
jgi:hypothetical protein